MELNESREKAVLLRRLHQGPKILTLPNAWDAAGARLFEAAGFEAVATTSAGIAFTLGYPDGQIVPREEMLFMLRRIAATVRVPVTADIEAGYGAGSIAEVLTTVRGVLAAGAIGINLEDATDGGSGLVDMAFQAEKIKTVRALGESEGIPLVINARTDAFAMSHMEESERLAAAVARGNAYLAAGADCVFVPFVKEISTISALVGQIHGPVNILATAGSPSPSVLESLGVKRVSVGGGPCRAAMAFTRAMAEDLRASGSYVRFTEQAISYADANRLFT